MTEKRYPDCSSCETVDFCPVLRFALSMIVVDTYISGVKSNADLTEEFMDRHFITTIHEHVIDLTAIAEEMGDGESIKIANWLNNKAITWANMMDQGKTLTYILSLEDFNTVELWRNPND